VRSQWDGQAEDETTHTRTPTSVDHPGERQHDDSCTVWTTRAARETTCFDRAVMFAWRLLVRERALLRCVNRLLAIQLTIILPSNRAFVLLLCDGAYQCEETRRAV
jgi:hypothetical protein